MESVDVEKGGELHLSSPICTIDWLPLYKEPGVLRSSNEYYGDSIGNVVLGCEDGGVYLYHVSSSYPCLYQKLRRLP